MQISSRTAVLASACVMVAGASNSQTQSNQYQQTAAPNFYVTTPQTGEQTAVGGNYEQATANIYTGQTAWQTPVRQSARKTHDASAAASRAPTVQQVSNRPSASSPQQQYANNYTNSTEQQAVNYYTHTGHASATHQSSAYGNAPWPQPAAHQTVYPAAYVSNVSSEKKGLMSRLLHRNNSSTQQQQSNAAVRAARNVGYRASKLAGNVQQGVASWYGGKWHGRKTANGERFNQESMTAAHRTLPFGTVVKVTNERNGRECMVRINNRGPFTKGRILDLSKAAARQLGMMGSGVAKVKMEVVGES